MSTRILRSRAGSLVLALLVILGGCAAPLPQQPTPGPTLAKTLKLYNWSGYMPQPVLNAFEAEYGVHVEYIEYESMEDALASIRQGQSFDVAVLEQDVVPLLRKEGLLARLNHLHIPNLRNIAPDFRNLAFDPENAYSVPFNWGTTGLVVRTDLLSEPIRHWNDLWNPALAGRVAVRAQAVEVIGVTLLALGLPINTDDPAHLAAAERKLLELHPAAVFHEADGSLALPALLSGDIAVFLGWPADAIIARAENPAVAYILPEEGAALWQDTFAISSATSDQYTAEVFINFLLRADIGAQIINEGYYASANDAATLLADPAIVKDPVFYPPLETIHRSQWYAPMSAETERRYQQIWEKFLASVEE